MIISSFAFFAWLAVLPVVGAETEVERIIQFEDWTLEIQEQVLRPWAKSWESRDVRAFQGLLADRVRLPSWADRLVFSRAREGISEYRWRPASPPRAGGAAAADAASRYFASFARVEAVSLDVIDADFTAPDAPWLRARFDLRGKLEDGSRRTDRGLLRVRVQRREGRWKLAEVSDQMMETLVAQTAVFEDRTAAAGLSAAVVSPRLEAIRRGGYALAVGDYDDDGYPDIYSGGWGPGQLFRNTGDGRFRDVTLEAGLGRDTAVKAAVWADLDGDGRVDLALQRFVEADGGEAVFYKNAGAGRLQRVEANVARREAHDRAMSMAAADFNGDGKLDLYFGHPGVRDFTDPGGQEQPGLSHQAVYLNRGGWSFEEMTGPGQRLLFSERVRPHSALATDLDADGRPDLLVVDDRGNGSRLYLNQADRFSPAELQAGIDARGWGMMAVAGDYDGDGRDDLYFTNIDLDAGRRVRELLGRSGFREPLARFPEIDHLRNVLQGNRLYRSVGDGSFREVTETAGVGWAGQAPAGAQWLDYNGDGLLDLYVANGLWSADPDRDYSSHFIRQVLREAVQEAAPPGSAQPANPVMALLQRTGASFAGHQRNRLFRNNGDGTFTEVGYLTGADRIEDGYMAAYADFDRDGRVDLVLRNADPPSLDRPYAPLTLLRNAGSEGRARLVVHLRGGPGRLGIGARLTLRGGARTQVREVLAVVGAVQNEAAAFFGLGADGRAESLEVRWPSGRTDRFAGLTPGHIVIEEGAGDVRYLSWLGPEALPSDRRLP